MSTPERELKCYWMRGLPACGKTQKALELVEHTQGIICDPNQWFKQTGEVRKHYNMSRAIRWSWGRAIKAAKKAISPIVIDMDVAVNAVSIQRLKDLEEQGYSVELVEPDSNHWKEIKNLLADKESNKDKLDEWAKYLAAQQDLFNYQIIRTRMNGWRDLSIKDWRY